MKTCFVRLTKFLLLEDIEDWDVCKVEDTKVVKHSFEVEKQSSFHLSDVNLKIFPGEFIAIVGSVGTGKSSLLSAIIGQMTRYKGKQTVGGKVAYVCQETWIQNRTVRDNVLFDSEMDKERYQRVLDASQLTRDLGSLPHGDQTEIGERGTNLSGGQKARVSVARALYASGVQLYVMDDPLSAVDAHVGGALFQEALVDFLRGKTRVVVMSSNYHLLNRFDKVIVVEHGKVMTIGPYRSIVKDFPQYEGARAG
eukprot:gene2981-3656_t